LRARARRAGLTDIAQQGNHIRFAPVELPESREVRVQRLYPRTLLKPTVRTMLVPVPKAGSRPGSRAGGSGRSTTGTGSVSPLGAPSLRDAELLAWCEELIGEIFEGQLTGQAAAGEQARGQADGQARAEG
jgi:transcription-repair coupling factor (superfamily II helicase)